MTDAQINIAKIVKFVNRHYHGENEGQVMVLLDTVPNVIRFDCTRPDCTDNLQVPYNPEHL
jgi:hypothetical protein